MIWKIAKRVLFALDPERAHEITLHGLKNLPMPRIKPAAKPRMIGQLVFPNAVGLAAGMDKNAECLRAWQNLGFGFAEVGTITALPQNGNPKPRLFRLTKEGALFNRMGFNNDGAEIIARRIAHQREKHKLSIPIGINIGKSAVVPVEEAPSDYLTSFRLLADLADYITINVSSPNTKNLRQLQDESALKRLLDIIASENSRRTFPKPLLVKIAPDLSPDDAISTARAALSSGADGLIVSNTSTQSLSGTPLPPGGGGLSGTPLFEMSTSLLNTLRREIGNSAILVGSGGIMKPNDAAMKMSQGADLVQVYTGFVYGGPRFPAACVAAIETCN